MSLYRILFPILLVLLGLHDVESKYDYLVKMNNDAEYNLYKSGANGWIHWAAECDALGDGCVGFDSEGNLKKKMDNLTSTNKYSIWIKTPGPESIELPGIWPYPASAHFGSQTFVISSSIEFQSNIQNDILDRAIERYRDLIFSEYADDKASGSIDGEEDIITGDVILNVESSSEDLQLDTDESYSLEITSDGINITAKTIYGAMYGLETLSQLVEYNHETEQYEIKNGPWEIEDAPQFRFRGLMIDTSRHYLPVNAIEKIIDSLSYAKLNVLHWHMVDAQSFPLESKKFPKLWQGAWSPQERYTQAAVRHLVQYAKERGVKLMPEFDGPGHAWSWGVGYPELLPEDYEKSSGCDITCPTNPCNVPLDPTNPFTYEVLTGLFSEITGGSQGEGLFPFDLLHLGGDEVKFGCWNQSEQIINFMEKFGLDFNGLYMYYINKASSTAMTFQRTPVHWEEVFNHFGTKLNKKTIIHIWLNQTTLANVVNAGYRAILSNYNNWYLDLPDVDWTRVYQNDPYEDIYEKEKRDLILGGEACVWGETSDPSDVFQRIWPRAGAFAERVWNYKQSSNEDAIQLAIPRLLKFRCLLLHRGIGTGTLFSLNPTQPGGCSQ